jgi:hypothetical protein
MAWTINNGKLYFNTVTYTGNASTNAITVGLQPDFTWLKVRSAGSGQDHTLYDSVRGATKFIETNTTNAEATGSNYLTSFDSNGFTLGNDQSHVNGSGDTYVSWNWKANGSGSANTDGSINSTVSANTTSGFSIVTVSKPNTNVATIGHGLGVVPAMIIGKNLASSFRWIVYQKTIGNTKAQYLNENFVDTTSPTFWNNTSPTSSVFTIGSDNSWNGTSVFYCFAEKQGYSKFGSYTGNGSTDGTFVYTGFKPAFVMIKATGLVKNWLTFDNRRLGYNGAGTNKQLHPNTNGTESSGNGTTLDILSNGFKTRTTDSDENGSGQNYIYMAFAENPFTSSTGTPVTAR